MLFNNLISTDRCRSSGESDTRAEVFWRVKPTLLLKASCRWSGAAAIIPTKTVSAGSARVRVCRVANAFIRDAAGLAYIDDQGRLFPLLEVDEDDEEPVLFESEQIWFSKNPDGHYVIVSLDGSIALRVAPLMVAEDGSDEDSTLFPLVVEDANGNHQRFVYHAGRSAAICHRR